MKKQILSWALVASAISGLTLAASSTVAATVTLTFGTEANQALIENYFNGGTDSQGASGVNYGIAFGANAESLKAGINGAGGTGTGKFENLPAGGPGVLYLAAVPVGALSVVNVAGGF